MQALWQANTPQPGRLLRFLFLWHSAMPADASSTLASTGFRVKSWNHLRKASNSGGYEPYPDASGIRRMTLPLKGSLA